jgi:hypothetical protein
MKTYTIRTAKVVRAKTGQVYWEWFVLRDGHKVAYGRAGDKQQAESAAQKWIGTITANVARLCEIMGVRQ